MTVLLAALDGEGYIYGHDDGYYPQSWVPCRRYNEDWEHDKRKGNRTKGDGTANGYHLGGNGAWFLNWSRRKGDGRW